MFTSIGYLLLFILGITALVFGLVFLGIGFYNLAKKDKSKKAILKHLLFGIILLSTTLFTYTFFSSSSNSISAEYVGIYNNILDSNSTLQLRANGTFAASNEILKPNTGKWQVYEKDEQRTIDLLDARNFRIVQFKVNRVNGKIRFQSVNTGNQTARQIEFVRL